jgi:hypothetical protein
VRDLDFLAAALKARILERCALTFVNDDLSPISVISLNSSLANIGIRIQPWLAGLTAIVRLP